MLILILGSRGMLGQALAKEFRDAGYEVADWDRADLDITNREKVLEKINELAPKIIINAAAYNNVDRAEAEDKEMAFKINAEAVSYLAEVSARIGAFFAHYSTDYVFRGDQKNGYAEDSAPDPQSVYAKSKFEGENRLLSLRAPYLPAGRGQSNLKFYLIRTSRLFGPAGSGEGAKKGFVEAMIDSVKNHGKTELDLVDEEVSSPTYVVDLARATRELLESGAPVGIYHRTNFGACTWYEWARKIFKLVDLPVELNPVSTDKFSRPAKRPKFSKLLNTKLPPLRKWEDALAEYLTTIS